MQREKNIEKNRTSKNHSTITKGKMYTSVKYQKEKKEKGREKRAEAEITEKFPTLITMYPFWLSWPCSS